MTTLIASFSRRLCPVVFGIFAAACLIPGVVPLSSVLAQSAATGLVTGRVINPTTGEYIRNVEVRIEGTQQVAITEEGGFYRLSDAPVGEVTLVATYPGHQTVSAHLNV